MLRVCHCLLFPVGFYRRNVIGMFQNMWRKKLKILLWTWSLQQIGTRRLCFSVKWFEVITAILSSYTSFAQFGNTFSHVELFILLLPRIPRKIFGYVRYLILLCNVHFEVGHFTNICSSFCQNCWQTKVREVTSDVCKMNSHHRHGTKVQYTLVHIHSSVNILCRSGNDNE